MAGLTQSQDRSKPFRVLVLGGSTHHPGGVEAFCERSAAALGASGTWEITRIPTNTAYLSVLTIGRLAVGIGRLLQKTASRPDCIWLQYGNFPDLVYLMVARLLGFRVMVTPHLGSAWRSQSNPVLRHIGATILRLANRFALISFTQEQELALHSGVPRSLIRNFLPSSVLTVPLPHEDDLTGPIQIIHSGRLSEGKGSFLVVDVCAGLRDRGVPFSMRITGGAEQEVYDRINALIAQHDVADSVVLLGRVSEDDLLDHLRHSDVLLHLSRVDSYPLIVLEAMACGVLPVCMELAGARDQVTTYGGHVVPQQTAIPESIAWIAAQDPEQVRRDGRRVSDAVRRDYSWKRCAGALDAALRACIAGDRSTQTRSEMAH